MKSISKILFTLVAMLTAVSCDKNNEQPITTDATREIIYTVAGSESRASLHSEAEWDALLDQLCDYAASGQEVAFCSLTVPGGSPAGNPKGPALSLSKAPHLTKDVTTFSTTDRKEMKDWMKRMEKEGKTVNVRYDESTRTWSGTAYLTAVAPQQPTDEAHTGVLSHVVFPLLQLEVWALVTDDDSTLVLTRNGEILTAAIELADSLALGDTVTLYGTVYETTSLDDSPVYLLNISTDIKSMATGLWHYDYLAVTSFSNNSMPDVNFYSRDGIYFDLHADGTLDYRNGSRSEQGSWSLNADGTICCELFDAGGGCWNISWLTAETMVLTRHDIGSEEGDIAYQMMLSKNF